MYVDYVLLIHTNVCWNQINSSPKFNETCLNFFVEQVKARGSHVQA